MELGVVGLDCVDEPGHVGLATHELLHLLADQGFSTYSTLIEARAQMVAERPDLVQRFVDASIVGWYNYLYGDRHRANAAMLRDNPDATEAEFEASTALMKSQGVVDSGMSITHGIGAMSPERVREFYGKVQAAGLYKQGDVDLDKVAVYNFVNKGVGLDLRRKPAGP